MKILITGCAGFIGFHLTKLITESSNVEVFGIDNLNTYYDVDLKKARLKILKKNKNFKFERIDITNEKKLFSIFSKNSYTHVIHLAAQAGVRYSIKNPETYVQSNLVGFFNVLNLSSKFKIKHFLFASTSSVYGSSKKFPLNEDLKTDSPLSFYAATKKSNELMAYSYSNIHKLPCTALRFFTVYGPYGRPDMALFLFTEAILNNKKVNLNNSGKHIRDFTYIDDVIDAIKKMIKKPSKKNIPFEVYNVTGSDPKRLKYFLSIIEKNLQKKSKIFNRPLQKGDVYKTYGDNKKLKKISNFYAKFPIEVGIKNFLEWFKYYYKK